MKILHLVHQYLPDFIGGTELYTQQLAQQLAQRGHQNEIVFRRDGDSAKLEHWQERDGIRVWAMTSKPLTPNRRQSPSPALGRAARYPGISQSRSVRVITWESHV